MDNPEIVNETQQYITLQIPADSETEAEQKAKEWAEQNEYPLADVAILKMFHGKSPQMGTGGSPGESLGLYYDCQITANRIGELCEGVRLKQVQYS